MSEFSDYLDRAFSLLDTSFPEEEIVDEYDVYENIRHKIKDTRVNLEMTREQLAKASGVRLDHISKIENGMCRPTVATLIKIAKGFNRRLVICFEDPDFFY